MKKLLIISFLINIASGITTNEIYDNSWALIIGIDKYKNINKLNYAVKDAKAIKSLLKRNYGFKAENITLILNENATYSNIRREFASITKLANENDRVLIYFAGHGQTMNLPNGGEKGFLLPVEALEDDLYFTGLPMDELRSIALMSRAKHILYLIDACYGGIAAVGTRGLNPINSSNYIHKITNNSARQVITAGGKGEEVIEKSEWGHSAFTKNIQSALKFGNADFNNDNVITANELALYLIEKVSIDSDNLQTPQYGRMTSDEGEFVFISPKVFSSLKEEANQLKDLLKRNAELEARIKYLENINNMNKY